jgi:hypothetical protein
MKPSTNVRTLNTEKPRLAALPIVKIDMTKRVLDATLEELSAVIYDASLLAFEDYKAGEQPGPDLLTGAQMAAKIGVSRSKLHFLRVAGLPSIKVGDTYKFEPRAVMEYLRAEASK